MKVWYYYGITEDEQGERHAFLQWGDKTWPANVVFHEATPFLAHAIYNLPIMAAEYGIKGQIIFQTQ